MEPTLIEIAFYKLEEDTFTFKDRITENGHMFFVNDSDLNIECQDVLVKLNNKDLRDLVISEIEQRWKKVAVGSIVKVHLLRGEIEPTLFIAGKKLPKISKRAGYCHKCKQLKDYTDLAKWKRHVTEHCPGVPLDGATKECQHCGHIFTRAQKASAHDCPFKPVQSELPSSKIYRLASAAQMEDFSKLGAYDKFFQAKTEKLVIPGQFPGISVPKKWRSHGRLFPKYGNVNSVEFYTSALMDKVKAGGDNYIILDSSIIVTNHNGQVVSYLTSEHLTPLSKDLACLDLGNGELSVSLRNPPPPPPEPDPDLESCSVYNSYTMQNGYECQPHK